MSDDHFILNKHEECNIEDGAEDWDVVMDQHNNRLGRMVFDRSTRIEVSGRWPSRTKWFFSNSDQGFADNCEHRARVWSTRQPRVASSIAKVWEETAVYIEN